MLAWLEGRRIRSHLTIGRDAHKFLTFSHDSRNERRKSEEAVFALCSFARSLSLRAPNLYSPSRYILAFQRKKAAWKIPRCVCVMQKIKEISRRYLLGIEIL
ncbi:hypothetical protein CEXT_462431 [Caerostris extrusa]|uniref:Uncharacterized protein n=1 Tax=Caerostris extrusa TaxID=172846 RepID=A0AAV4WMY7_CAEEX|nr:hypothetical protein CEXT_462431 [Caerostris extrusa]